MKITYEDDEGQEHQLTVRKLRFDEFWELQKMDQQDIASEQNKDLIKSAVATAIQDEDVDLDELPAEAIMEVFAFSSKGAIEAGKKLSVSPRRRSTVTSKMNER